MTKKSQARLKRDNDKKLAKNYAKSNQGWDDVKRLYTSAQNVLNSMCDGVTRFFSVQGVEAYIPPVQRDYTITLINGFANDLRVFQARLNMLYAQHRERKGMVDMEDENNYAFLLELFGAYVDYNKDVETVLTPLHLQILGVIQTVENNLAAAVRAEQQANEVAQPA